MARYCDAYDVRFHSGLQEIDATDIDLEPFLDPATKAVIETISVESNWEILTGSSDSTNWYTEKYPIADTDGDMAVGTTEVEVYGWTDITDADSRTQLTVSSVVADEGKVVLASAPGSTYEAITCNYRYYTNEMDWTLVKQATAEYAGYLYAFTKWVWIPDTYQLGPVRIRNIEPVWEKLYKKYSITMSLVRKKPYAIEKPWIRRTLADMDTTWEG